MLSTWTTQAPARPARALGTVVACLVLVTMTGCGSRSGGGGTAQPGPSGTADGGPSAGLGVAAGTSASASPSLGGTVAVPAGVTAGIVIYDRRSATFVIQQKGSWRFRSASLVKLLIALDYF